MLVRHPGVGDAIVVLASSSSGEPQLAAYVVRRESRDSVDERALRDFCRRALPEYMVPSAFVFLDALPLTSNGKVDRRALPAPEAAGHPHNFVGPGNPTEQVLAEIWSAVLNLRRVGIHDGFFSLGGHSLKATQVVARINKAFKAELTLRQFYESPTIAGLAAAIEPQTGKDESPLMVRPAGSGNPLSFAQERLWFLDRFEPDSSVYNFAVGIKIRGDLNRTALQSALSQVVARHEVLRTTFSTTQEGRPSQNISTTNSFTLRVVQPPCEGQAEKEAEGWKLLRAEAHRPFDRARLHVARDAAGD